MAKPDLPADFDPDEYLSLHADVRDAGIDPVEHYLNHGYREKRPYRNIPRALRPRIDSPYDFDGMLSMHNHDFMEDPAFVSAYRRGMQAAGGDDYKFYWRAYMAQWAARSAARVEGDFVECGVNYGVVSSMIMHMLDWDSTGRMFWLLDTFTGIDPRFLSEKEQAAGAMERNRGWIESGLYTTNLAAVEKNFAEWRNKKFVVGSIPETLDQVDAKKIAFMHIDMNCSPPEVAAIDALWGRMERGGIVLLDDYAYRGFQPQKEGMDAWAASNKVPLASLPTGQGLMVKA